MSTAATADTAEASEAKVRRRKGPMIIIAALTLAIGGGAGWWFSRGHGGEAAHQEEAKPELPPVYLPLESITVNLQPEEGDQYLQTEINLKLADDKSVEKIKLHMPEVRNHLLMLLSSKRASEVISIEGKARLRSEIMHELLRVLDPAAAQAADALAKKAAPAAHAPSPTPAHEDASGTAAEAATHAEAPAVAKTETEKAPTPAHGETADSPIIDVLFTSFIVQ